MKKVLSLSEVQTAINNKWEFYEDLNGKMYEISFITVLQMKLIDLIVMIKEGKLYYQSEY
jgi:hypothetical protein